MKNRALTNVVMACAMTLAACSSLPISPAREIGTPPDNLPAFAFLTADRAAPLLADWLSQEAPALQNYFEDYVYGNLPERSDTHLIARTLRESADSSITMESMRLKVSAWFGGTVADTGEFDIDLIAPTSGVIGVLLLQTFCPFDKTPGLFAASSGGPGIRCEGGVSSRLMGRFGRRIAHLPIQDFLDRGFAIAALYSRSVVPDDPRAGIDILNELAPERAETDKRWGAIAAWGWLYGRMIDALIEDPRFEQTPFVAFGHSRLGKAALLAAAYDSRIAAVVSNQSGTGGAALARGGRGETVTQVTRRYPHWFSTRYDSFAGREDTLPVDQHQLLALIAPRPIFLGNARRDLWSDPLGAFHAAQAADRVYEAFGVAGLNQAAMGDYNPLAEIAFWLRPGFHGVERSDWTAILQFLDAHFGAH